MFKYPIIGLIGVHKIGETFCSAHSGKNEVANIIGDTCDDEEIILHKAAFADEVKQDLCGFLGITRQQLEHNKSNLRRMMQGYATDYRRKLFGDDYWVKRLHSRLLPISADVFIGGAIITDVREPIEVEYIRSLDGILVRVSRNSPHDTMAGDLLVFPSESQSVSLPYDIEIQNFGSLQQLQLTAVKFTHEYLQSVIAGKYHEFRASRKVFSWEFESYQENHG